MTHPTVWWTSSQPSGCHSSVGDSALPEACQTSSCVFLSSSRKSSSGLPPCTLLGLLTSEVQEQIQLTVLKKDVSLQILQLAIVVLHSSRKKLPSCSLRNAATIRGGHQWLHFQAAWHQLVVTASLVKGNIYVDACG